MAIPTQTTGLGVAAKIVVPGNVNGAVTTPGLNTVVLSLSGTNTFQLVPVIEDAAGNAIPVTPLVLTAVAASSGGSAVYTGTITGGAANALAGTSFTVAGFAGVNNNGVFVATASSATTITLANGAATAETHAGTVVNTQGAGTLTYVEYGFRSLASGTAGKLPQSANGTAVATVSGSGLITGVTAGGTVVEISYPAYNNTVGTVASSGNIMNGLPINKVYAEVNVTVGP